MYSYDLKSFISKPILKLVLSSSDLCMIPLFHGTDKSVLELPASQRAHLRECCSTVIDYLLPVYKDNGFENLRPNEKQTILGEAYPNICNAYSKATLGHNDCALYQYTNVYLTFDPDKADIYAKNAYICGELGYIAHWLLDGADRLKYQLPSPTESQNQAIAKIVEVRQQKPEPVIMAYFNIPKNNLRTEKNGEIDWKRQIDWFLEDTHIGEVRVIGEFDLLSGTPIRLEELPRV